MKATKITAALFEGLLKGPEHALYTLSKTGSFLAIYGAATAYALSSGKEDSILANIHPWINSSPQSWFFGGMIKGALVHELYNHPFTSDHSEIKYAPLLEVKKQLSAIDSQILELKQSEALIINLIERDPQISFSRELKRAQVTMLERENEKNLITKAIEERSALADQIEKLSVSAGLVDPLHAKEYTTTVAKISKWTSGFFTMALFGALLHYELDAEAYQKLSFSKYLESHLLDPITLFLYEIMN